ncbi:uncharacterized protein LOC130723720 [Lotus japonicus]|uniref:uncharacterized protein LOC130723720 n=1 Tax=Lotus japonicus TaxID=34305 RepID=UPI0025906513|nr:uncharacterized protein LOC130723720 [Lotus japonicus]
MCIVEFQKRGLPHAHILIWLSEGAKLRTGSDIDKIISVELSDPTLYPSLSNVVSNFMLHGPCGLANKSSPCMKVRRCKKFFPKDYEDATRIDEDGYPKYERRQTRITISKKWVNLDNIYVMPYNPQLLMRYQTHINVEYCNKSNAIKYLFKYVNKGPDRVSIEISNHGKDTNEDEVVDEIKQYYDYRYLSPCEAVWRIFQFYIHDKWPPIHRLAFHLPNEQSITFRDYERIDRVVERSETLDTMFLAWFEANKKYPAGRNLTYAKFPQMFVYDHDARLWKLRKQGFAIGRLTYIPLGCGEIFYMRLFLTIQKGCTSFNDVKTFHGQLFETFRDACYALGLLADDKEFIDAIKESSKLGSGHQLRRLFATLLFMCTMSIPDLVWNVTWRLLADGILHERRRRLQIPGF